jgi:hypothetical protein
MIILYLLLIAYIIAINFYAFMLVKSLRDKERDAEVFKTVKPSAQDGANETNGAHGANNANDKPPEKYVGKLCITGALGGAIAIYVSMFILKFRRTDLLLMVLMPLLGVLNIYIFVLLFKSGFGFLMIR